MATDHVRFDSTRQLAEALTLCWNGAFPDDVRETASGHLAISQKGFNLDVFRQYAKQHNWQYEEMNVKSTAKKLPLRNLISAQWTYRDPLRHRGNGTRSDSGITVDTTSPSTEYLLGARSEAEAHALLALLTAHLMDGIELVPIVGRGAPAFRYFWLLRSEQPPLDVLQAAGRTWWGPVASGAETPIYLEWPYSLDVPRSFLQRLPWNAGTDGIVLLNRPADNRIVTADGRYIAPDAIVLRADFAPPQPMEQFAELRMIAAVEDAAVARDAPEPLFEVDLRLERSRFQDHLAARVRDLKEELTARQLLLQNLQDELDRPELPATEPLLLYFTTRTAGVPDPLRRLLVEWTDQEGDLRSVCYARLDGATLPDGFDRSEVVHVVTTSRALGRAATPGDASLGARLTDYRPAYGNLVHFDGLQEWIPFGLRLFVPHRLGLQLYPKLAPGPVAASRLTRALFGRHVNERERPRRLVLLVNDSQDRLRSCLVDAQTFVPIADAIGWQCAVEVAPPAEMLRHEMTESATELFFGAIERDFEMAVEREAQDRIDRKCAQLQAELTACSSRIDGAQERNRRIVRLLESAQPFAAKVDATLRRLHTTLGQIRAAIPDPGEVALLGPELTAYDKVSREIAGRKAEVDKMLLEIESLRR